jgi:hypothetical protein
MKFSIRDLFLVTVIVALVLGWIVDHRRISLSLSQAEEEASFSELGWKTTAAHYDFVVQQLAQHDLHVGPDDTVRPMKLPTSQVPAPNTPKR